MDLRKALEVDVRIAVFGKSELRFDEGELEIEHVHGLYASSLLYSIFGRLT